MRRPTRQSFVTAPAKVELAGCFSRRVGRVRTVVTVGGWGGESVVGPPEVPYLTQRRWTLRITSQYLHSSKINKARSFN